MIHLHWAIHNHQPVGNFDFIFERAYQQAYKPFVDVLSSHPRIRMSMHFSGILLDWLEANRPEYIKNLRAIVERGQLEMLGGGFYEPILPVISDADKIGQLKKLQDTVKRLFGVTPKGIWLAERVWEPTLVKPISEAGLEFVLLDGSHFKMVGKTDRDMDGYFMSEDQGHTIKLFPIHDVIRDYIPFRSVDEVINTLLDLDKPENRSHQGDVQVVFGDDGEKFGDWPFTHQTVYTDGWLHRFFERAEGLGDRLQVLPIDAALKPEKNLGLVYLPPASYQEMMIWAQDSHDIPKFRQAQKTLTEAAGQEAGKFLRGTFWRNFFNKYSESNQIHKQGIRLAKTLEHLKTTLTKKNLQAAQDFLWQSQCNCGYWHGVFGGLYLPHLRFALYRNLIDAQKLLDKGLFAKREAPIWEVHDWNCDGKGEYTLNSPEVYLSLTHQGEIDQFWLKKTRLNVCDTLTRRFEAYHDFVGGQVEAGTKLENTLGEKEANLRGFLIYDKKIRHSLADVFMPHDLSFQEYATQKFSSTYTLDLKEVSEHRTDSETEVRFLGLAHSTQGAATLRVEKSIFLQKDSANLKVVWSFTNMAAVNGNVFENGNTSENAQAHGAQFRFGCESLFCLLAGNAPDRTIVWNGPHASKDILASHGEMHSVDKITITDEWLKLKTEATFTGTDQVWRDAIETVSQSEGGYERVYQGTVVIPIWDFQLAAGAEATVSMSLQFQEGA